MAIADSPLCLLLELPRELRDMIYAHVYEPSSKHRCTYTPLAKSTKPLPSNLLLTCRQVSAEFFTYLVNFIPELVLNLSKLVHTSSIRSWMPSPVPQLNFMRATMNLDLSSKATFDVVKEQLNAIMCTLGSIITTIKLLEINITYPSGMKPNSPTAYHSGVTRTNATTALNTKTKPKTETETETYSVLTRFKWHSCTQCTTTHPFAFSIPKSKAWSLDVSVGDIRVKGPWLEQDSVDAKVLAGAEQLLASSCEPNADILVSMPPVPSTAAVNPTTDISQIASMAKSHQPCFLLGIPRELRNHVFGYLYNDDDPKLHCIHTPHKSSEVALSNRQSHLRQTYPLLFVNKQLSADYTDHLLDFTTGVTFILDELVYGSSAKKWVPSPLIHKQFRQAIIKLNLDHYTAFAAVKPQLNNIIEAVGNLVISLRAVRVLNFIIDYPSMDETGSIYPFWWDSKFRGLWENRKGPKGWSFCLNAIQMAILCASHCNPTVLDLAIRQNRWRSDRNLMRNDKAYIFVRAEGTTEWSTNILQKVAYFPYAKDALPFSWDHADDRYAVDAGILKRVERFLVARLC
ncbi:hypothetical protein EJ08DRAFT_655114 [Tothia fuscella]|uniref:Uncharacterized protein n=1 Tax=Tothia fuscella TaxID=1048955 RepID=A0A9P4P2A7_9PEZI|nr:hypothetical protein EJ08DRAFT_655114 [Tothia fuscella]